MKIEWFGDSYDIVKKYLISNVYAHKIITDCTWQCECWGYPYYLKRVVITIIPGRVGVMGRTVINIITPLIPGNPLGMPSQLPQPAITALLPHMRCPKGLPQGYHVRAIPDIHERDLFSQHSDPLSIVLAAGGHLAVRHDDTSAVHPCTPFFHL